MSDEDEGPESDPYCAHWISIFDEEHEREDVRCENCGESCREHPIIGGSWCPNVPPGVPVADVRASTFKNERWPSGEISPIASPSQVEKP